MAFASEVTKNSVFGNLKVRMGTFSQTSTTTGGNISTGLNVVEHIELQHTGTAVIASAPVVNETLPLNGGDVTIVTVADADGVWIAYGS